MSSSDEDDVPLIQRARSLTQADEAVSQTCKSSSAPAPVPAATLEAPAAAGTAAPCDSAGGSTSAVPAAKQPARKRKSASVTSSSATTAQAQAQAAKKSSGVSSRAARTGAGGFDLSEASGDLDAEYETLGVLGRGNFAEVNLVRHRQSLELRALKFCCKLDAPSYTHLRAEALLASRVSHPLVLSPLAISDSPGRAGNFSVLLPLCAGGDFLQLLRRQPGYALSEAAACSYGAMVVLGLRALHDAGLCYRDLKPENLLIRDNGYLCIADFGFSAPVAECKRLKVGTTMYQAPELLRKPFAHGLPVDWWALGCLLLEMVTGSSPFQKDDDDATEALVLAHTVGMPPPAPPEGAPTPSDAMADLCGKLLHPASNERLGDDGIQAHPWFASIDWSALAAMSVPPPSVPAPLDTSDTDQLLIELTSRTQQGFDF